MLETYKIAEQNLHGFYHEIEKLNKKAVKLGVSPIALRKTGVVIEKPIRNEITNEVVRIERSIEVELNGASPKFAGWTLAAVLEQTDAGTLIRKTPDCKIELAKYREAVHKCDHCQKERRRSETFIVLHDSGDVKQIGRNCIKDFLGHKDPHQLAKWAELMFSACEMAEGCEEGDFFGGGGSARDLFHVNAMLSYSACAIRLRGYISVTKVKESMETNPNLSSTRQTALAWMNPRRDDKLNVDYFIPEDCDKDRGQIARQFVLDTLGAKDADKLSDFENNLLIVCKCETVDSRNAGILAYVPEYFARETEKRVKAEAEAKTPPCHFGTEGQKVKGEKLTYIKSTGFETQFGYSFLHSFQHVSGARICWMTGVELDLTNGEEVNANFTIKKHDDYKGFPQTKVTRMKVWNDRMAFA